MRVVLRLLLVSDGGDATDRALVPTVHALNVAIVDGLDLFAEELPEQLASMPPNCTGTAGSLGTIGGCVGTFGTYGSLG